MKKSKREYALERAEFIEKEKKRKTEENGQEKAIFHVPVVGKNSQRFGNYALCSPEDFELLIRYCWSWTTSGYAISNVNVNGKTNGLQMSRLISNPPDGFVVDHIDGNKGNNTRENLRNITKQQNAQNRPKSSISSSDFFGVRKSGKKFIACVINSHTGKQLNFGSYDTELEAAVVYDRFIAQNREQYYQKLNFPEKIDEYLASPKVEAKTRVNKHGFKGISRKRDSKSYVAQIIIDGKIVRIGSYPSIIDAAKAYDSAIVKYELNRPFNFPQDYLNYCPATHVKTKMIEISDNDPNILEVIKAIGVDPATLEKDDILVEVYPERQIYSLIERQDYPIVEFSNLSLTHFGYVIISQTGNLLSRLIMNCDPKLVVDHRFSNVLDNRKRMLKVTTVGGNMRNAKKRSNVSSPYKGVNWHKKEKKWNINIMHDGVKVYRKSMSDCLHAGRQRDLYCILKYPGEYRLNFTDWAEPGVVDHWRTTLGLHANWPNEEEKK